MDSPPVARDCGDPPAHVGRWGGPKLLVLDLDPPWRAVLDGAARRGRFAAVKTLADPSQATAALSFSPDIVLWNLGKVDQFDYRLQGAVSVFFPCADVLVAVDDADEETVVKLLRSGVTYLCDKKDGPAVFEQSLLRVVGFDREVRAWTPPVEIDYEIRNWVEISAPSERAFVDSLARFVGLLTRTALPERERRSLGYALREIGQNAIEWGNENDPRKRLRLSFCILEDRIMVKLQDEGRGFDVDALPDVRVDPLGNLLERRQLGKRVGGYGLAIVAGLMDDVLFSDKGNTVILVMSLGRGRGVPPPG